MNLSGQDVGFQDAQTHIPKNVYAPSPSLKNTVNQPVFGAIARVKSELDRKNLKQILSSNTRNMN